MICYINNNSSDRIIVKLTFFKYYHNTDCKVKRRRKLEMRGIIFCGRKEYVANNRKRNSLLNSNSGRVNILVLVIVGIVVSLVALWAKLYSDAANRKVVEEVVDVEDKTADKAVDVEDKTVVDKAVDVTDKFLNVMDKALDQASEDIDDAKEQNLELQENKDRTDREFQEHAEQMSRMFNDGMDKMNQEYQEERDSMHREFQEQDEQMSRLFNDGIDKMNREYQEEREKMQQEYQDFANNNEVVE